jgi:acid phosphatase family membrane protein YuiD
MLRELLRNRHLIAVAIAWFLAQGSKPVIYRITEHKWDWRWLLSAGGMPSAHSAAFVALATAVGILEGFDSAAFAIAVITAIVVLYDAAGVRRSAGAQAKVLNQILEELFAGRPIAEEHLRELIGHTPFEVLVGAALGITISALVLRR